MAPPKRPSAQGTLPVEDAELIPVPPVSPQLLSRAPQPPPRKGVPTRENIPPVPPGPSVPDTTPSPPTLAEAPGAPTVANLRRDMQATATSNLILVRNVALGPEADNHAASDVGEPSTATNGAVVFYTGNWYAALSTDGGATFKYVDPFHAFPDPPGMSFCCDQVVQYAPKIDTFFWLLQYVENQSGANIQRLAYATTADIQQGKWKAFDITPQNLGLGDSFLDFPDLAVGANYLYVTTNVFQNNQWTATVLLRLPLAGFKTGKVTAKRTISRQNFNFRVAQNVGTRAFWATHQNTSTLRVFQWDERALQPRYNDVTVATWTEGNYASQTPDSHNWLGRCDSRLVGAAQAGNELWFGWSSGPGGANNRPNCFAQIARINATTLALIENVNLWNPDYAIAYPALAANTNNEVGVSYAFGGGQFFPSHAVGILTNPQQSKVTANGLHGPADNDWGDYLTVRRHSPNGKLFAATGYTLDEGSGRQDGTPRFVLFGRSGDIA
ncbi:MAG: hypothetical protein U0768_09045 [Anaerolineae bacterium]